LETTPHSIEDIALACGFGSSATLRHHFRARLATSPAAYRARFSRVTDLPHALRDSAEQKSRPRAADLKT
jgi:AraC family transcriptional regulator, transcriptional activator FtrA